MDAGFIDVTKSPFNADSTGVTDATAGLQGKSGRCADEGARHGYD